MFNKLIVAGLDDQRRILVGYKLAVKAKPCAGQ